MSNYIEQIKEYFKEKKLRFFKKKYLISRILTDFITSFCDTKRSKEGSNLCSKQKNKHTSHKKGTSS